MRINPWLLLLILVFDLALRVAGNAEGEKTWFPVKGTITTGFCAVILAFFMIESLFKKNGAEDDVIIKELLISTPALPVARRGNNQYSWIGFGEIPRALSELKEEGMREKFGIFPYVTNYEMVLYDEAREEAFKLTPDD